MNIMQYDRTIWLASGLLLALMAIGGCRTSDTPPASLQDEANRARAIDNASEGANIIYVFSSGERGADDQPLTMGDAESLRRNCPALDAVAPIIRPRLLVSYGAGASTVTMVYGTVPEYLKVRSWEKLAAGMSFSQQDVDNSASVCLVGQTPAEELFKDESPIGRTVTMAGKSFHVIGLLARRGANSLGYDVDDVILVPITSLPDLEQTHKMYLTAKAKSAVDVIEGIRQIEAVLREQHHLGPADPADFSVHSRAAGN